MTGRFREVALLIVSLLVAGLAAYAAGSYSVGNAINDTYFHHVGVWDRIKVWVTSAGALAGLCAALVLLIRLMRARSTD
ncbi:MAG TPA: hypothetical protein PLF78_07865 [Caulobacter sp.]|nr:hypothetical protein [Caulobacter sp.]